MEELLKQIAQNTARNESHQITVSSNSFLVAINKKCIYFHRCNKTNCTDILRFSFYYHFYSQMS